MNRGKPKVLDALIHALKQAKRPLTLHELAEKIIAFDPEALTGKTPNKTLYGTVFRAEKKKKLFKHTKKNNVLYLELIR